MRRLCLLLLAAAMIALVPGSAYAATVEPTNPNSLVVFSGDAVVAQGETVQSVVVFDGSATIDGSVTGSVVVFSGPVMVSGDVEGDVLAFSGLATIQNGAHVSGDVYADRRAIASGARIDGTTDSTARFASAAGWAWVALWIGTWIAVGISLLLLGLLLIWFAPKAADAVFQTGKTAVGPSIGWGAAMLFGLPLIAVLAMVTIVGLPVGLGLLFALGLIYAIGMVSGSWFLGRSIIKTGSRAGAYAIGWVIVTVVTLVPGLGGLAWIAATGYGLGILVVAAFRAARGRPTVVVPETPEVPSTPSVNA
jgi:hypothetical protein